LQQARIDLKCESGRTALHWACCGGSPRVVVRMLNAGAHFNERDGSGFTPLMLAAKAEHLDVINTLLSWAGRTLYLDARDSIFCRGETALHWAISWSDSAAIVRRLLDAGANPTLWNRSSQTPLDIALQDGHVASAALLAQAVGQAECARLLIKARCITQATAKLDRVAQKAIDKGKPNHVVQQRLLAIAPPYFIRRIEDNWGGGLPQVDFPRNGAGSMECPTACVRYALEGMPKHAFVMLAEFLVPRWDRPYV
jgi:hypothetical protein